MRDRIFLLSALLSLAGAGLPAGEGMAGSCKGVVRDWEGKPPADGLPAADVRLRSRDGALTDPVQTDADGGYEIDKVPDGDYTLVVVKVGYVPRPHNYTKVKVAGDVRADDVRLIREYGDEIYYSGIAAAIVGKAAGAPANEKRNVYTTAWDDMRVINLPPSSKARLASELNRRDPDAVEMVPDLKYYTDVNPEDVKKVEVRFNEAIRGKADFPGKGSLDDLKINPQIVADCALHQAKGAESATQREAFVNEFLLHWDDTPASKRFKDMKKDLDKHPDGRTPDPRP